MSDTPTSPGTPNEPEGQETPVSPDSPPEVSDAINEQLDKHDAFTPDPGERPVAAVASDKDAIVELSGKVEEVAEVVKPAEADAEKELADEACAWIAQADKLAAHADDDGWIHEGDLDGRVPTGKQRAEGTRCQGRIQGLRTQLGQGRVMGTNRLELDGAKSAGVAQS